MPENKQIPTDDGVPYTFGGLSPKIPAPEFFAELTDLMTATPDDFTVLRSTAFAEAIVRFEELTTQSRRAFLLGAGASYCAGLPLLADLTRLTLASAKLLPEDKAILEGLQANFDGAPQPNIEDSTQ